MRNKIVEMLINRGYEADILSNYVYEIKIESDGWRISYGK